MTKGTVYLVGAGPGDPGLLTVRAAELLARAQVVAYDELIAPELLDAIGPAAELVAVGRRGAEGHPVTYRAHPAVIEHALRGASVVRLKAGDPFVFGRGGEEAEELAALGIPFEVVPGISAALGAAASTRIPLTHRDHASDVTFVTGHDLLGGRATRSRWEAIGRGAGTVVLYMAAQKLAENLARLVRAGRAPETPAAYVAAASTVDERVVTGTLATLADAARGCDRRAPAIVIVGDVVRVRAHLAELGADADAAPLAGARVIVGRARPGPSAIAAAIRARGARVRELPRIDVAAPRSFTALDRALDDLAPYGALVFACAEGVDATFARVGARDRDVRSLTRPLVALGARTAARLRAHGIKAERELPGACVDALATAGLGGSRILVIGAEGGRPSLHEDLARLGARAVHVGAYRLVIGPVRAPLAPPDALVLPSSSAAAAVLAGAAMHADALTVVIGARTEAAARALGATRVVCAERDTPDAVVQALEDSLVRYRVVPSAKSEVNTHVGV